MGPILYPSRPTRVYNPNLIRRKDPAVWGLQFKFGGHHMIASTHEDGHMFSRHGKPLSSAAGTDFSSLCRMVFGFDTILDGELMLPLKASGEPPWYVVWDIPVHKGRDLTNEMYVTRLAILNAYRTDFKEVGRVRIKHNLWISELMNIKSLDAMLQSSDGKKLEGVVAKNMSHNMAWSRLGQLETTSQLKFRTEDYRGPEKPPRPRLVRE